MSAEEKTIGVISDTHGQLRPSALEALRGSDLILHAGDVGGPGILGPLGEIAEVVAVRGNVDGGELSRLPLDQMIEVAGVTIYMIHILDDLDLEPAAAGIDVVVFGHSHQPEIREKGGVLYFNPGSAGPRRFRLPVSLGRLVISGGQARPELIELEV